MHLFDVICHIDGCENSEITITITVPDVDPMVVCGPCGNEITDIVSA